MKIQLTFKTPDVVDYALECIEDEDQRHELESVIEKFVEYGEYVSIEIDSETKTARVLEV